MHPLSQFGLTSARSLGFGVDAYLFDVSSQWPGKPSDILSKAERQHAWSLRSAGARQTYIRSRCALRQTLGWMSGTAPADLDIRIGAYGKPYLCATDGAELLQFNLSHSGEDLAIAAGRGGAVGIDIERRDQSVDTLSVAEHFFCRDELRQLEALDGPQRQDAFLRIWVRKEAAAKAAGLGLATSRTDLIGGIELPEHGPIDLEGRCFRLIDLPPIERLVGAVAVEAGPGA